MKKKEIMIGTTVPIGYYRKVRSCCRFEFPELTIDVDEIIGDDDCIISFQQKYSVIEVKFDLVNKYVCGVIHRLILTKKKEIRNGN
jgi:hypothetical protein